MNHKKELLWSLWAIRIVAIRTEDLALRFSLLWKEGAGGPYKSKIPSASYKVFALWWINMYGLSRRQRVGCNIRIHVPFPSMVILRSCAHSQEISLRAVPDPKPKKLKPEP